MFGKKKKLGIQAKVRTKQEIDQEYTHHAVQVGHKMRIISQLQDEIDAHTRRLVEVNAEGMRIPREEPKTEAPTPKEPA